MGRFGLDVAPQPRHEVVDGPGVGVLAHPPHLFEEGLPRHRRARVLHQIAQQRRLHQRQRLLGAVAAQHLIAKVHVPAGKRVLVVLRRLPRLLPVQPSAAPEQPLDPRQQDGQIERLGQIVVGARLESAQDVVGVRTRRQQHDRDETARRPQPPHDLETVEARQHDVEQHDVEGVGADAPVVEKPLQGVLAVVLDVGREPLRLEIELQPGREMFFVFDDEDTVHDFKGSSRVNVLPRSAPRLSAYARPPCRRATASTIDSPRPVPRTRDCSAAGSR